MKKSTILGIVILITITILSCIIARVAMKTDKVDLIANIIVIDTYNKYPDDVDKAVQELMSSDEYNRMDKNNQIKNIGELLEIYEENHVIRNLYYDKVGPSYTFTYNKGDIKGALGGVLLKDWDPMMN